MTETRNFKVKALTWHPYLPPVELTYATPEQLAAMQVTPSSGKVSPASSPSSTSSAKSPTSASRRSSVRAKTLSAS